MRSFRSTFAYPLLGIAVCVLAVALCLKRAPEAEPAPPSFDPTPIDAIIAEAQKSWDVPGVAVAVIRDDRVIYLKGFGIRQHGEDARITPDTLFPIASCTKAFTTTALAMLVDEGKLAWDDPVRKHVPQFKLADPLADSHIVLRDLVSHRAGVGSNDFLWYRSPWGRDEVVRRIGLVKPKYPFRAGFEYQSTMFTVAGMAVESASGQAWEDFVQKRICTPLGMKDVAFTTPEAQKNPDHARPHRKGADGSMHVIPEYVLARPEPSGSMSASARDLAQWVRFQLGDGSFDGRKLVSSAALHETHTPQNIIPFAGEARAFNPNTAQMSYGMAWVIQDYHGRQLVSHAGQVDGFRTHITLVPRERLGIVVLTNLDRTRMNLAVSNAIVDKLLDLPARDWNDFFQSQLRKAEKDARTRYESWMAQRNLSAGPTQPLKAYVGDYSDPAYGTARIVLERGQLIWKWSTFSAPLVHFHYDTFVIQDEVLSYPRIVFTIDRNGEPASFQVSQPLDVEFRRDAEKR
ncbi:hypothetical protein AYO40_00015 [Planctomycetaceae bacterium SCGC AG-212-D15]|nr:hypothetical protein AYO40_00015 [Planctomycetaceae bacterium SCGC AG-212-D15]